MLAVEAIRTSSNNKAKPHKPGVSAFSPILREVEFTSAGYNQRLPRRTQRELQRFPWNTLHKRVDNPSEPSRDAPSQRDRFALDQHAIVSLFKCPVRIQPP